MIRTDRPALKLVGEDGNAYFILGRAQGAARAAGWTKEETDAYANKAMSGDYNNLLRVTMEHFDCDGEEDE